MKVLFDNCIRQDAIRGEYVLPEERSLRVIYRPRPKRNDWKQKEIDHLGTIAGLCQRKKIIPYITEELEVEEFRILPWPSPNYKDLFADIKFKKAQCPIRRSKWGLSLDQYIDKEDIIKYCKCFFLTPSLERTEKFIGGMRHNPTINLSEFEEKCLRRSHIFKQICHGINEKHFPDALHLWTAEENGLDVFLTTDKKFKNVMARQRVDLKCIVMFPSELINVINGGAALGNPRADA